MLELVKVNNENTALINLFNSLKLNKSTPKTSPIPFFNQPKKNKYPNNLTSKSIHNSFTQLISKIWNNSPLNSKIQPFNHSQQDDNFNVLNNLQSLQSKVQSKQKYWQKIRTKELVVSKKKYKESIKYKKRQQQ